MLHYRPPLNSTNVTLREKHQMLLKQEKHENCHTVIFSFVQCAPHAVHQLHVDVSWDTAQSKTQ